jgi:hypothetical protein
MLHALAAAGAVASLLGSIFTGTTSNVISNPPPDKIVIDLVTVNGSGCPAGTAAVAVSPDNTAFTVTYSNYLAQVGVGATPTDFRKNCQLNIIVHVPQGFTYAVSQTDYRGFAALERGATGTMKASYYFQGSPSTATVVKDFKGPLMDNWQVSDTRDVASLVYAPCGELRNFNINTELRTAAGTSNPRTTTSFMTMDSTDSAISTTYHFSWMNCPKK